MLEDVSVTYGVYVLAQHGTLELQHANDGLKNHIQLGLVNMQQQHIINWLIL